MLREVSIANFFDCLPVRERKETMPTGMKVFTGNLGNFTVVVVQEKKGGLFAGVAKRNPSDRPSNAGFCIAAVRAWRDYQGKDAGYDRQHSISKAKAKKISIDAHVNRVIDEVLEGLDDLGLGIG